MQCTESVWSQYRRQPSIKRRNSLATANAGLVRKVAHRWARQCAEPVEDLIQIGELGLLKAVERFDPTKEVAFSSFAVPYVNGEIMHFLRDGWSHLKIPRRAFEEAGKVKAVQRKMAAAGRNVSLEASAEAVGLSPARWQWVSEAVARKQMATLDAVMEVADESDDGGEHAQLRERLMGAMSTLPSLERRCVVEKYFGDCSDQAIACSLQITPVQVQAILEAALSRIKEELSDDLEA